MRNRLNVPSSPIRSGHQGFLSTTTFLMMLLSNAAMMSSAPAQGTFQNLDFESANVPTLPLGQSGALNGTLTSDALPFWTAYYGSSVTPVVTHNNYTLGDVNVSILGPNWDNNFGTSIMDGQYTAVLQAGDPRHFSASIAQTGSVPGVAESIQMRINPFGGDVLGVTFAGHDIPMVLLAQNTPSDWLVGGDISPYAGQTGELRISALSYTNFYFGSFELDDITFSTTPIPEPGVTTLLIFGAALFGLTAWRRKA